MDVSIIIVNYNTCAITKQCIDSIFEKTKNIQFEIILVDNASKDDSYDTFSKDKRIKFISSSINLGFGKANNLGYKEAEGKYIFLLNSDTILCNNAIKIFFDYLELQDGDIAGVGTLLKATDRKTIGNSFGIFPTLRSSFRTILSIYTKKKLEQNNYEYKVCPDGSFFVDYVIGADLFLRRSVIEELGLFDPDFFMYFEETEMQYRYTKNGYRLKIFPEPSIVHLECASTGTDKNQYNFHQRYRFVSSWFIYMKKTQRRSLYILFKFMMLLYLPIVIKQRNTLQQNIKLIKLFI